ncbi:MAG TPA: diguanylate cyclase [Acidimicrobiales bacterium]|nr:diguanylate cyclase [Acidimicrobiales bacterium]
MNEGHDPDPRRLLDASPDALIGIDAGAVVRYASAAAERMLGWRVADWIGRNGLDLVHPGDHAAMLGALGTVTEKDVGRPIEARVRGGDGTWRWIELVGRDRLADPEIAMILLALRDVTERRRLEVAAGDASRFEVLLRHSPTVMVVCDADGRIATLSSSLTRLLGHDQERIEGRPLADLAHRDDAAAVIDALGRARVGPTGTAEVDVRLTRVGDGAERWYRLEIVDLLDDPVVAGVIVAAHDITELHEARLALEHMASHDQLTGLANRRRLLAHLDAALTGGGPVAVLYIDLDGFKPVNDLLGHGAGDEVLVRTARRIEDVTGGRALVARLGGDEFAVLLADDDAATADEMALAVAAAVAEPFRVGGGVAHIGASVGVATAVDGPRLGAEELLADADRNMYRNKHRTDPATPAG